MSNSPRRRRRIPYTDAVAETLYVSSDRSVREYKILDADGTALGYVSFHGKRKARSAGYHEGRGVYAPHKRRWSNLTEAARTFQAERKATV